MARILIVENDPLLAQAIALHIETLDHEVAGTLARGEDVLSQGMALSPDLILMDPERSGRIDTFHKPRQGKIFPVEVRFRALESEGHPIMMAVARNITLKKKIELSLCESEEQFRQIAESMQQVLWNQGLTPP